LRMRMILLMLLLIPVIIFQYRLIFTLNDYVYVTYLCKLSVNTGLRPSRQFPNIISPGTGLFFNSEKQEIVCCARGNRPPSLHNLFCLNPSVCRMREHKLYQVKPKNDLLSFSSPKLTKNDFSGRKQWKENYNRKLHLR